jgi:hypothetical protein
VRPILVKSSGIHSRIAWVFILKGQRIFLTLLFQKVISVYPT